MLDGQMKYGRLELDESGDNAEDGGSPDEAVAAVLV